MTIEITEALAILGAKRVIWIDDRFNSTPAQVASMLIDSLEIAIECGFDELASAFTQFEFDPTGASFSVTQILTDLPAERLEEIKAAFFAKEGEEKRFPATELSTSIIDGACRLLGVMDDDRWTFQKADKELPLLCSAGDAEIGYIVDLNETGGSATRGLEMLRVLWESESKGSAFILTHEADIAGEGTKEIELQSVMSDLGGLGFPLCVISKERLTSASGDVEEIAEALRVGVKRAGLRRSLHQVLESVRGTLSAAIDSGLRKLLRVPPEVLDNVFDRGYQEGVSELHVVERAITAHMGKEAREFFGNAPTVQANVKRLRALRAIPLKFVTSDPDPNLMAFRLAEVWENDDLINLSLTPIACGDVFELDPGEEKTRGGRRKFILLGQPCDISLRPGKERAQGIAFLVPLKVKAGARKEVPHREKEPLLPFMLNNEQWACDFRSATAVRLSILDLASFRSDGRVRVDDGHRAPAGLLPAQARLYDERTRIVSEALSDPQFRPAAGMSNPSLQLTFGNTGAFKHIHVPSFEEASQRRDHGQIVSRVKRATWCLRRCGRIRMPYSAALLDQYTSVMSRWAFELDFISPGVEASGNAVE